MRKFKLIAAVLAALVCVSSVTTPASAYYYHHKKMMVSGHSSGNATGVWLIFGCASGIILAAFAANYRDGRELTPPEAWSCGTLFWFSQPRNP